MITSMLAIILIHDIDQEDIYCILTYSTVSILM